jgi:hypothetical protein
MLHFFLPEYIVEKLYSCHGRPIHSMIKCINNRNYCRAAVIEFFAIFGLLSTYLLIKEGILRADSSMQYVMFRRFTIPARRTFSERSGIIQNYYYTSNKAILNVHIYNLTLTSNYTQNNSPL